MVTKLSDSLTSDEKSNPAKIEAKLKQLCKGTKKAENRFVSIIDHLKILYLLWILCVKLSC